MKRLAAVFLVAVLVPTLALAWLAVRSMRDQELVINSQRALLHQRSADALAGDLRVFLDDVRVFYGQLVDEMIEEQGPETLSRNFDELIRTRWSQARFGSVVTDTGEIVSPAIPPATPEAEQFLEANRLFLTNRAQALVYRAPEVRRDRVEVRKQEPIPDKKRSFLPDSLKGRGRAPEERTEPAEPRDDAAIAGTGRTELERATDEDAFAILVEKEAPGAAGAPVVSQSRVAADAEKLRFSQYQNPPSRSITARGAVIREKLTKNEDPPRSESIPLPAQSGVRNVFPALPSFAVQEDDSSLAATRGEADGWPAVGDNLSRLERDTGNLKELMGDRESGALSRFLQDGLHILLWQRHPLAPDRVFWAELDLLEIRRELRAIVDEASAPEAEACFALLDSDGDVVAQTVAGYRGDWRRPFVASEVGEILPHWEVAAYLVDPGVVTRSARIVRLTVWLLVPCLVAAVAGGVVLVFRSVGYEMRLARRKTDFVSNVSHELKTPLTSIRMFSELLERGGATGIDKSRDYAAVISREASRLTRLINNLLDFSRLERGDIRYRDEPFDLGGVVRETAENFRLTAEEADCALMIEMEEEDPVTVAGDRDAIEQVLLNLLSNAAKYGASGGEIALRMERAGAASATVSVLDRGPGIARKHASKIFEKFYRADDSLSSGIQGSGLGLTLARQIVSHHGGSLVYRNRPGGGSCFLLTLPVDHAHSS